MDVKVKRIIFDPWTSDTGVLWACDSERCGEVVITTYLRCFGFLCSPRRCWIVEDGWNRVRTLEEADIGLGRLVVIVSANSSYEARQTSVVRSNVRRLLGRVRLPKRVRYAVLHRDGFRCRYCGARASDGASLHIDHIVPVSRGGTDDEENLCCACSDCNIGKGNRYSTRPA